MTGPTLWDRLERLLHREHHAILLGHRDLMTLPIDERVERGDSLADLGFLGEVEGGRIRLRCPDNLAKFRVGDPLRLGNGDETPGAGLGVLYESFDDGSRTLVVSRDPFRTGGQFDPRGRLQLDPEAQSLTGLALEALTRVRSGHSASALSARAVLEGAAVRVMDPVRRSAVEEAVTLLRPELDASQRDAFAGAMAWSPVTLVQGPPGTGKTHVLARIVSALAADGKRVLVTAYTHRAVNHALRKIAEADPSLAVVKAGKHSAGEDLRGSTVSAVPSLRRLRPEGAVRRVVGATVLGLRSAWDEGSFDFVVMDEAAQVPLAYAPCALLCAPRYVLVGDHRQLGPIVQGRHADPFAGRSVFEHLAPAYPPVLLRTTYRMNEGVNAFPSAAFYGGRLSPSRDTASARFERVPGGPFDTLFDPELGAVVALVRHEGFRTRSEPEARVVAAIVLDRIVRQRGDPRDVAVVSPYRAQLRLIRTLVQRGIAEASARVPLPIIDTVERIQGQERDLVVVSLAASDPDHLAGEAASFFYSGNRLNVTVTRARTKLIVVASPLAFEAFPRSYGGLADAERFRRLRRDLPAFDVTPS